MISPTEVVKRVGVGGRLVAFFKAVCVYFALAPVAPPSAVAVAGKVAPVLCLLLLVLLPRAERLAPTPDQARYVRLVSAGLALSALGDALLVWPQYFVAGMAAFAAAHVAYISAFGWGVSRPLLGATCYAASAYYLTLLAPPGALRLLVPLYGLLLASMVWRALAQARGCRLRSGRAAAAAGAVLFLLSDAFLGYSLFGGVLPYRRVAVMSTYYVGQLGIALSALDPPAPLAAKSS